MTLHNDLASMHDGVSKALAEKDAEIGRLRARLGIVISALRFMEEATGETFDDEGGDIAGIEAELRDVPEQRVTETK